jgi:hypothetical protein
MPRKPCTARIEASEARTFVLRSSAKVTAFLKAAKKADRPFLTVRAEHIATVFPMPLRRNQAKN